MSENLLTFKAIAENAATVISSNDKVTVSGLPLAEKIKVNGNRKKSARNE
jgi:hypothetical protein